jgi:hypothetical protein
MPGSKKADKLRSQAQNTPIEQLPSQEIYEFELPESFDERCKNRLQQIGKYFLEQAGTDLETKFILDVAHFLDRLQKHSYEKWDADLTDQILLAYDLSQKIKCARVPNCPEYERHASNLYLLARKLGQTLDALADRKV